MLFRSRTSPLFICLALAVACWQACHNPASANEGADESTEATGEPAETGPFLAMGVRVGEVSDNSAVIWTRLTEIQKPKRKGLDVRATSWASQKKTPKELGTLWGACPGAPGKLRVRYSVGPDAKESVTTEWVDVNKSTDFTHQFAIHELKPATQYHYTVETTASNTAGEDNNRVQDSFDGQFSTAPSAESTDDVMFTVVTGQGHRDLTHKNGYQIYRSMRDLQPDFMVPTGDTVYLDSDWPRTTTVDIAKYHWQRAGTLPRHIKFWRQTPGYWMKDDHDIFANDCWPALRLKASEPFTFEEGLRIFREQTPSSEKPYRTFRWGRDLQIWLLESREFRMPNDMPDGPEKTLWGKEQKAWVKQTVAESDATWKVFLSPTPIVGPPREGKFDNHSSAFRNEGSEIRQWLASQGSDRVFFVCGDIHYQYHSVDSETQIHEFSCGPASDEHAGGSSGKKPEHRFIRVGGGFLTVAVSSSGETSRIRFQFHTVMGGMKYEYLQSLDRTNLPE